MPVDGSYSLALVTIHLFPVLPDPPLPHAARSSSSPLAQPPTLSRTPDWEALYPTPRALSSLSPCAMRALAFWRRRSRERREKKLWSGLTSSTSSVGCSLFSTLLDHRPELVLQLEHDLLEELVSMVEAGDDGLLGGERVPVADGGEQLVDGLEEDSGVGGFRLDGTIGGDGGDAAVEGFDGLVKGGEDLEDVVGHGLGASEGPDDAAGTAMSLSSSFSVFSDYDFRDN
ncbi:hypothetical protein ACLOJK_024314 [Asimina triloba]